MKNVILPARLKEYKDGYAVVEFKQVSGDEVDRVREEVLNISVNSESQNLPNVGKDILLVFDHFGETHILGEVVSANQPAPDLSKPKLRRLANDSGLVEIEEDGTIKAENEGITQTLKTDGKVVIQNGATVIPPATLTELIALIHETFQLIGSSSCVPSSPLSNSVQILANVAQMATYKE